MALQLAFVLVAIIIGARLGGIGLGVMGGIGLAILTFGFGLQPTSPPIDVMLMIATNTNANCKAIYSTLFDSCAKISHFVLWLLTYFYFNCLF